MMPDAATKFSICILFILHCAALVESQIGIGIAPNNRPPPIFSVITEVSAMCTMDGITAMIMFNNNFNGKIYSYRYADTHECVYYNNYDMNMILFSIPNYRCGTQVTKNQQNAIVRIENEVYVQFDKETQNAGDRRYLFICELGPQGVQGSNTVVPPSFTATARPFQTIIVQTLEPTAIIATSSGGLNGGGQGPFSVTMEIQDGQGPNAPPVTRPLKLGDSITLVIAAPLNQSAGAHPDMSVHSCYAADGGSRNRVQLLDDSGCSSRAIVVGNLQKQRTSDRIIFYSVMQAFKFPQSEDVYFTCSVDMCSDCNFTNPCSGTTVSASLEGRNRIRREFEENMQEYRLNISDSVRIYQPDLDTHSSSLARNRATSDGCLRQSDLAILFGVGLCGCLLLTACVSFIAWKFICRKRRRTQVKKTAPVKQ